MVVALMQRESSSSDGGFFDILKRFVVTFLDGWVAGILRHDNIVQNDCESTYGK